MGGSLPQNPRPEQRSGFLTNLLTSPTTFWPRTRNREKQEDHIRSPPHPFAPKAESRGYHEASQGKLTLMQLLTVSTRFD